MVALVAACGGHSKGMGGDDDADSGVGDVVSLEVVPPAATVDLVAAGTGYSAMQTYQIIATRQNGSTQDITQDAGIALDQDSGLSYAPGVATATIAGHYTLHFSWGGQSVDATLDANLKGSVVGTGITPAQQQALDGTPGSGTPTIAYPPAGALFPVNVAPLAVHAKKSDGGQAIARVRFTANDLDFSYYETCAASPNPGTFADACLVSLEAAFATQLGGVSEAGDVSITVRLAAADGTKLAESAPITAAWARSGLAGGLYYWTTAGTGDTTFNTAIARYDFNGDASAPMIYLSSADAPAVPQGQTQCVGCHAVSPDGAKLSFSLGGSTPGFYSLYDVASRTATSTKMTDKFADMATFSKDGSRLITMSYGALTLRAADASLAASANDLFPEVTEKKSHPFWSPAGNKIAFVSWNPSSADMTAGQVTGDMVQGGQIWIAPSDGTQPTGQAQLIVPRVDGFTHYYPAISDDEQLVVFNRSSCSGPANTPGGWGQGPCDGYNDISAQLMIVPSAGGAAIALTKANGGDAPLTTNSWPRWSPDHGLFRGKRLYWIAFSSRRAFGLALKGATDDTTKPQLWFAAIAVPADGSAPTADPSFAAIWLPGQDPSLTGPRGNHTPVWTSKAVVLQ